MQFALPVYEYRVYSCLWGLFSADPVSREVEEEDDEDDEDEDDDNGDDERLDPDLGIPARYAEPDPRDLRELASQTSDEQIE